MKNAYGLIVLVMMIAASPASTFARLGETKEECQQRYGNPQPWDLAWGIDSYSGNDPLFHWAKYHDNSKYADTPILEYADNETYDYRGWRLKVAFVNGKAIKIMYLKYNAPPRGKNVIEDVSTARAKRVWEFTSRPPIQPVEAQAILEGQTDGWQWCCNTNIFGVEEFSGHNTNGNTAYLEEDAKCLVVYSSEVEKFGEEQERLRKQEEQEEQQRLKDSVPKF